MPTVTGQWVEMDQDEFQQSGGLYRAIMSVRLPYSSHGAVEGTLNVQAAVTRNFETVSIVSQPPMASGHSGTLSPWTIIWTYRVRPDGDSVSHAGVLYPWVIATVIGVVIGAFAALALLSKRFEKFVEVTGDALKRAGEGFGDALDSLFPVAILALVALVVTRRGRLST